LEQTYTLVIVPATHDRVRKIVVRERLLKRLVVFAGIGALVLGLLLIDYARGLYRGAELKRLRAETAAQRVKAAQVALDLAELENGMSRLRKLEGRLRTAFDLDRGLFSRESDTGVGGDEAGRKSHTGIGGRAASPADMTDCPDEHRSGLEAQVDLDLERMKGRVVAQEQDFSELVNFLEDRKSLLASTPSIMPVRGWVSSGFQRRPDPFSGATVWHRGLDISTDMGTPVLAPADGIVNSIGYQDDLGNLVSLDHGHGYLTRYGHNSKIIVRAGQQVRRGQVIALAGNTGRSTGPHLHYEVFHDGVLVNPSDYIIN
jgi:murein DD-endopeptidase MepM/ murein hydrolase activator NlpD